MELISREIYNKLLHNGSHELNEADDHFDFNEYLSLEDPREQYQYLNHLSDIGQLKFVRDGSSRRAFLMEDGRCLKSVVSLEEPMFTRGIHQNQAEISNWKKARIEGFQCFPQIFQYDEQSFTCLVTECCTQTAASDWLHLFNCPLQGIMGIFALFFGYNSKHLSFKEIEDIFLDIDKSTASDEEADEWLLDYYTIERFHGKELPNYLKFLRDMQTSKELKYKVLWDLLKFIQSQDHDVLDLDDLCLESNWGLKSVNGHDVAVVIDSGMSDNVLNIDYNGV